MNEEVRLILNKCYSDILTCDETKIIVDYLEDIENENKILKHNNEAMQEEMNRSWEKLYEIAKNKDSEIRHYKFLRDIKDIIRNKEVGFMETCDILELVINKELEKYE